MDNILVTGSSQTIIYSIINNLNTTFYIKDIGLLHYFLGIEATFTSNSLLLTQTKNTKDLLTQTHLNYSNPIPTPMIPTLLLSKNLRTPLSDPSEYLNTIGALQYLCLIHPEIKICCEQSVPILSLPTNVHLTAVKHILQYLRSTPSHGIHLTKATILNLHAYYDADWASFLDDHLSTSGYCIFLGPNIVSWSAKKQPTIDRSDIEDKYRGIAHVAAELCWITLLLSELSLSSINPTLWCDNLGVIFFLRFFFLMLEHNTLR